MVVIAGETEMLLLDTRPTPDEIATLVAPVTSQLRVVLPPAAMELGLAVNALITGVGVSGVKGSEVDGILSINRSDIAKNSTPDSKACTSYLNRPGLAGATKLKFNVLLAPGTIPLSGINPKKLSSASRSERKWFVPQVLVPTFVTLLVKLIVLPGDAVLAKLFALYVIALASGVASTVRMTTSCVEKNSTPSSKA